MHITISMQFELRLALMSLPKHHARLDMLLVLYSWSPLCVLPYREQHKTEAVMHACHLNGQCLLQLCRLKAQIYAGNCNMQGGTCTGCNT